MDMSNAGDEDQLAQEGFVDTSKCPGCRLLGAKIKRLQKLKGTNDHPEHKCQRCGGRNIVWYADSDVWNRVALDYSILCPICFSELASNLGTQPTAWRLSAEGDDPEISKLRVELNNRFDQLAEQYKEIERLHDLLHDVSIERDRLKAVIDPEEFGETVDVNNEARENE